MWWLIWILLATTCAGVANVLRDVMLHDKGATTPIQLNVALAAAQVPLGMVLIAVLGLPFPPKSLFLPLFGLSVLYIAYITPYFIAFKKSDLTIVGPLYTLGILFGAVIGWVTLGETMDANDTLGCILMALGALAICKGKGASFRWDVFFLMVLSNALVAGHFCLVRWLKFQGLTSIEIFAWSRLGLVIVFCAAIMHPAVKEHTRVLMEKSWKRKRAILTTETVNGIGNVFVIAGIALGPSVPVVMASFVSGAVLAFTVAVYMVSRRDAIYRKGKTANLISKAFGTLLVIGGLWAVTV